MSIPLAVSQGTMTSRGNDDIQNQLVIPHISHILYVPLARKYDRIEFAKSGADGLIINYTVAGVAHRITFETTQVALSK